MTRRRRIATAAIAGTIIGFGALGMAANAAADPVPPRCRRARSPRPAGDRARSRRRPRRGRLVAAPPPVGPPLVPEIANPKYGSGQFERAVGLPAGCLAPGQGPVQLRRNAGRPDAGRRPTAAGCRSGAAAAARVQIADRPGVRSPAIGAEGRPGTRGAVRRCPRATTRWTGPPPPGYFDGPPTPNAPPGMAPIRLRHHRRPRWALRPASRASR